MQLLPQAYLQSVAQPAPVPPAGNAAPLDTPAAPVVDDSRPQPGNAAAQVLSNVRLPNMRQSVNPFLPMQRLRQHSKQTQAPISEMHLGRFCCSVQDVPAVSNAAAAAEGGPTDMELEAEADVGVGIDAGQTAAGVRTEGLQDAAAAHSTGDGDGSGGH